MSDGAEILWDVVQEHLAEAEFLVERWLASLRSPRLSRTDLQRTIERRLNAHLDGLAIGSVEVARALLEPALADGSDAPAPGVAAAALALLAGGADPGSLTARLRAGAPAGVIAGVATALQMTPRLDVDEPLRLALYATDDPAVQAPILAAMVARAVEPGPIAASLIARGDSTVTALALASVAGPDRVRHRNLVEQQLTDAPAPSAGPALRTALVWNLASGWRLCPAAARAGLPEAMLALALFGRADDLGPVREALRSPAHRASALFALGFSGRPEVIDACLPFVADEEPEIAALAAEAIAAVTGLPLFEPPFASPPGDGDDASDAELPPLEQDLRADLVPPFHAELPAPEPAAFRDWWTAHRASLRSGERYLRGQAITPAVLGKALDTEPLRRRGTLAFELAVRTGGRIRVPSVRLAQPAVAVPPDLALHRPPAWS